MKFYISTAYKGLLAVIISINKLKKKQFETVCKDDPG